jgi:hypothetical protein
MVGAKGFEPSTSWSRTRNREYISRCPGVSYDFSGRSQIDKFGQVPFYLWVANFSFRTNPSVNSQETSLPSRRPALTTRSMQSLPIVILIDELFDVRAQLLFCLFLCRFPLSQRTVETSATHRYQLTHVFGAQPALQWHQFSDVLVDALPRDSGRRLWEIQVRVGTPRSGVEASVLEPSIEESHGCGRSDR